MHCNFHVTFSTYIQFVFKSKIMFCPIGLQMDATESTLEDMVDFTSTDLSIFIQAVYGTNTYSTEED